MNNDDKLSSLIDIISRLEISARECENELLRARELIGILQQEERDTYVIAKLAEVVNTIAPHTDTRVRDRTLDLIRGVNIQIGDWVVIINRRPGQPNK